MKQEKSDRKLSLNKQTVADLTADELGGVRGGQDSSKECLLFDDLTTVSLGICSEEGWC